MAKKTIVHAFNFVASESEDGQPIIEGRILERLLDKLDQMQLALDDRVFDVIGEVLSLNEVNLPEMLREAAYEPDGSTSTSTRSTRSTRKLKQYEEATGLRLPAPTSTFPASSGRTPRPKSVGSMPKYVEEHFSRPPAIGHKSGRGPMACGGSNTCSLTSVPTGSVSEVGKPETSYRKLTFHKEHLDQDRTSTPFSSGRATRSTRPWMSDSGRNWAASTGG